MAPPRCLLFSSIQFPFTIYPRGPKNGVHFKRQVHDRDFYSAFATPQELTVRHDGRTIGSLSVLYTPLPQDHLLLGGRRWQVVEVDARLGQVLVKPAKGRKPPRFSGASGEIHSRIREEMRQILLDGREFAYLDRIGKEWLGNARQSFVSAGLHHGDLVEVGTNTCSWFTWTGTKVQRTLALLASLAGIEVVDERIALTLGSSMSKAVSTLIAAANSVHSAEDLVADARLAEMRKFDTYLPENLLRRAFACDFLDLAAARAKIAELASYTSLAIAAHQSSPAYSPGPEIAIESTAIGFEEYELPGANDGMPMATFPIVTDDRPIAVCEFVAFDLETTGLHPLWCRIVEIGAVRFRVDGTELGRFQQLVDPRTPIPTSAFRVHGISDDMVRGKPVIEDVLPKFLEFLGNRSTLLLAHNAGFDQQFLVAAAGLRAIPLPGHWIVDTLSLSKHVLPKAPNFKLETIGRLLGVSTGGAHRALADALLVKESFVNMLSRTQGVAMVGQLINRAPLLALVHAVAPTVSPPEGFETLAVAIEEGRKVQIVYQGGTKGASLREITPVAILETSGRHYLSAICAIDGTAKTYRMDRIARIVVS